MMAKAAEASLRNFLAIKFGITPESFRDAERLSLGRAKVQPSKDKRSAQQSSYFKVAKKATKSRISLVLSTSPILGIAEGVLRR